MKERIHLLVGAAEKERFRQVAAREGRTLSEWLRAAAYEKLAAETSSHALDTGAALRAFFAECGVREAGREPDWEAHRAVIEESIGRGVADA